MTKPTSAWWKPILTIKEILEAIFERVEKGEYGSYIIRMGYDWDAFLSLKYYNECCLHPDPKPKAFEVTLRDRILQIEGIKDIQLDRNLDGFEFRLEQVK